MNLSHRPTAIKDLEACLPLIRNGFAFEPSLRPTLLTLWRFLLTNGMAESAVIEHQVNLVEKHIVGFGISVFVTEEFAREAVTVLPPCLAYHVLCRWQQGHSPFLTASQIRRANSGPGLHGLILHNGWKQAGASDADRSAVRHKIMESFFAHHSGYHLQSFLHEIYGAAEREKMLGLGWRLETDYGAFDPAEAGITRVEDAPFLMSLHREDALNDAFHPFYSLFHSSMPRLYFRPAEQALLRNALVGLSDAEIAQALSISLFTVHKRWRAIYERVQERDSALLPESMGLARGAEKRSHLLRYLQTHPEELRPFTPPSVDGTR